MSETVQVCAFCGHDFRARRRLFCPSCLPPYGATSAAEYGQRYNLMYRAIGRAGSPPASRWEPPELARMCRMCRMCGADLPPRRRAYCSDACGRRGQGAIWRARGTLAAVSASSPPGRRLPEVITPPRRKSDGFIRSVVACPICRSPFGRRFSPYCSPTCSAAARKAVNARKNYRRRGAALGLPYTLRQVVEESSGSCHLCGEPVDLTKEYPDRMSPSIDHIVPIVKGGVDSIDNVALAHLECNSRRGAADIAV